MIQPESNGVINPETPKSNTLSFIVVGSGQVVEKYWLSAMEAGLVTIPAILTLSSEAVFRSKHPEYAGEFVGSVNHDAIAHEIEKLLQLHPGAHVALAIPADDRLALTTALLQSNEIDKKTIFFLEKPYARSIEEIDAFAELVEQHGEQLHLSGKYAEGRANILYDQLPQGVVPKKIMATLLEGSTYFAVVKNQVTATGSHPYLKDGPELDLGFHLMDIITTACARFGEVEAITINSVADLATNNPAYEPGYGFTATLRLTIKNDQGNERDVAIELTAGKYDGPNHRSIFFTYEDFYIQQEYLVGKADDPVSRIDQVTNERVELDRHFDGYQYYASELRPVSFGHQTELQQKLSLDCTRIMIEIQKRRLNTAYSTLCYATPHAPRHRRITHKSQEAPFIPA